MSGAVTFNFDHPCQCSLSAEPHYHIDLFTIIPWARFQASMEEYLERERFSRTLRVEQPIISWGQKDEHTN